uniref:Low-density lipoprotein receptor-related protein-like n=1 Tax=Saccoglossus kowalevskii TaxID=10224 RepID=A0ABM0M737_SACKO|nr:PREDICTED: low-density lipoprotein receptor-related protein-like [Saccoglossus kowalevskii]
MVVRKLTLIALYVAALTIQQYVTADDVPFHRTLQRPGDGSVGEQSTLSGRHENEEDYSSLLRKAQHDKRQYQECTNMNDYYYYYYDWYDYDDMFICDNGQCIFHWNQCNGYPDCDDWSDELNCTCYSNQLRCDTGICIYKGHICDGYNHCQDWSDETGCDCQGDHFTCNNGRCLPSTVKCDDHNHCEYGEDEYFCSCNTTDDFLCDNGRCIHSHYVCNNYDNCGDLSDERNCTCDYNELQCDGYKCISEWDVCDGYIHCQDLSDEINCTCSDDMFTCDNGICIHHSYNLCDGYNDCIDWSDELDCDCSLPGAFDCGYWNWGCLTSSMVCDGHNTCNKDELYCGDACQGFECEYGRCIPETSRCNHYLNCRLTDFSDEIGCACNDTNEVLCSNGVCIYDWQLCDGDNDCGDWGDEGEKNNCTYEYCDGFRCANGMCTGWYDSKCDGWAYCDDKSDEMNCTCNSDYMFLCDNGVCIEEWDVCNGYLDCGHPDISDEINCTNCWEYSFHCDNGLCINRDQLCDGYNNCGDWSDEIGCKCSNTNHFTCNNKRCTSIEAVCDGYDHCGDQSDEVNCGDCSDGYFLCDNGMCIPHYKVCDYYDNDCGDYSDEKECNNTECNSHYEFQCENGRCVYRHDLCDNYNHCGDLSDESGCDCNDETSFKCKNGRCIAAELQCDGYSQCWDDSDEINCVGCRKGSFLCNNGRCIEDYNLCDGYDACGDWSDENCGYDSALHSQCNNGRVIPKYMVCNGHSDCGDASDELNCPCEFNCTKYEYYYHYYYYYYHYYHHHRQCIPAFQICDGYYNCWDGSDEENCTDSCQPNPCQNDGLCVNDSSEGYHCQCQEGHHGKHCEEESDGIICSETKMSAVVSKSYILELLHHSGANASYFHLNDPACTGIDVIHDGEDAFLFETFLFDCGTISIEKPKDKSIEYINMVYTERGTKIIELLCCYGTEYIIAPIYIEANPWYAFHNKAYYYVILIERYSRYFRTILDLYNLPQMKYTKQANCNLIRE